MARSIDPDRSADCHANGSVPTAAFLVKGAKDMTICAHHLTHRLPKLKAEGWTVIPVKGTAGAGVGTESTPQHFSLGERA